METLEAAPTDTVLEVGPGHGELSELLVGRVDRLVLVEKDDRLAAELVDRWGGRGDVEVVHGDALELDLSALVARAGAGLRLVSNVPYAITSPLLFRLLDVRPPADRIVVMVQEEVARRVTATPGGKEYGALTVGVQTRAHAELAFRVSRNAFRPVPGVDSAVVVLRPPGDAGTGGEAVSAEDVRRLVRAAFSRRRKQIRTILRSSPAFALETDEAEALLESLGIDPAARPETLSPGQFVALAARLAGPA